MLQVDAVARRVDRRRVFWATRLHEYETVEYGTMPAELHPVPPYLLEPVLGLGQVLVTAPPMEEHPLRLLVAAASPRSAARRYAVVVSNGCCEHHRQVVTTAPALLVRGGLEHADGVVNVIAELLDPLPVSPTGRSRDFR